MGGGRGGRGRGERGGERERERSLVLPVEKAKKEDIPVAISTPKCPYLGI